MPHTYRVQVQALDREVPPLQFDCQPSFRQSREITESGLCHPGAQAAGKLAMSEQEHQAFIVGLNRALFGESMPMQHRKEELFKGFLPHFKQFMGHHWPKRTISGEEAVVALPSDPALTPGGERSRHHAS